MPLPDSALVSRRVLVREWRFPIVHPGRRSSTIRANSATNEQRQVNLVDNLSVTKGSHQLKFGVDYRWLAPFSSPFSYRQFVQFSGVTAAPGGALSGTARSPPRSPMQGNALLSQNFSLYGQDTWKITPD